MTDNPHFQSAPDWHSAAQLLTFEPRSPAYTGGAALESLQIFVRDHRMREVPEAERSLEAHYGTFVFTQTQRTQQEAGRLALTERYGREPKIVSVAGHPGRRYERGPEVPPDDPDGRSPAVVVWHDGPLFLLLASVTLEAGELVKIAASVHAPR